MQFSSVLVFFRFSDEYRMLNPKPLSPKPYTLNPKTLKQQSGSAQLQEKLRFQGALPWFFLICPGSRGEGLGFRALGV